MFCYSEMFNTIGNYIYVKIFLRGGFSFVVTFACATIVILTFAIVRYLL